MHLCPFWSRARPHCVGNLPHLARHEREGLIAPTGDVGALTLLLRRICEYAALRTRLAAAASARGATFPTWETSAALFFGTMRGIAYNG